jgi:transaldolase
MTASSRLIELFEEQGQSAWLDNLKREFLTSGELERIVATGVRGLTSNPTIFQKAIQGSNDYDDQFAQLVRRGEPVDDAYWDLVVEDILGALAVFSPVYASSRGRDGFVSVEVDPRLAHDTEGTIDAARRLWNRIGQPNLMVKIPATVEGLPAIRTLIAEGCNINVTLIFGLDRYRKVMEAYIDGLEERRVAGRPVGHVASVASFFISRVDSEVDRRLDAVGSPRALDLRGRAAVAQARLAYAAFTETFAGSRWENLATAGAAVQRPLWASTSTKNPNYPDTLYVDELIGPATVNTLPDPTLVAFVDHGRVARTIDRDLEGARRTWESLTDVGIDMDDVAHQLEVEGVAAFEKSFEELLGALHEKAALLRR